MPLKFEEEEKVIKKTLGGREEFILNGIAAYIEKNCMKKLTLDKLAAMACMNKYKFSRSFKERIGQSFISYLNNTRIKKAAGLLKKYDLSVTEIAILVGYENITHFNRTFKMICGESPRKYRERARKFPKQGKKTSRESK